MVDNTEFAARRGLLTSEDGTILPPFFFVPSDEGFAETEARAQFGLALEYHEGEEAKWIHNGMPAVAHLLNIRYVLEEYGQTTAGKVKLLRSVVFPQQPSEKRVRRIAALSIKRTLGLYPIREFSSDRAWAIDFRGIQGFAVRKHSTAHGQSRYQSGIEALLSFDAFLGNYAARAATNSTLYLENPEKARHLQERSFLVLCDKEEGLRWRVEVSHWDWDRTAARTRVANAEWSLGFVAYLETDGSRSGPREINGDTFDGKTLFVLRDNDVAADAFIALGIKGQAVRWAVQQGEILRRLRREAADALRNQWQEALLEHPPAGTTQLVKERLQRVHQLATKFRSEVNALLDTSDARRTLSGILGLATLPRQVIGDLISSASATLSALYDIKAAGYNIAYTGVPLGIFLTDMTGAFERFVSLFTAKAGVGGYTYPAIKQLPTGPAGPIVNTGAKQLPPPTVQPQAASGHKVVGASVVLVGNTAKSWADIAKLYLNDPAAWKALAAFNGAVGQYTKGDGSPLLPTDHVLVPAPQSVQSVFKGPLSPDIAYGTDLWLDPETGDLAVNVKPVTVLSNVGYTFTVPKAVDLMSVSGIANFSQALQMRFQTVLGSTPLAPGYGLIPMEPGSGLTANTYAFMLSTVFEQARKDARVALVRQAGVVVDQDKVSIQIDVVGTTGAQLGAQAPLVG